VKLAGDDFAAVYDDSTSVKVTRWSAPAGAKQPTVVWTQTIEPCP
jgi:hypothetical protein